MKAITASLPPFPLAFVLAATVIDDSCAPSTSIGKIAKRAAVKIDKQRPMPFGTAMTGLLLLTPTPSQSTEQTICDLEGALQGAGRGHGDGRLDKRDESERELIVPFRRIIHKSSLVCRTVLEREEGREARLWTWELS